jgi:7-cyano-7-deazaguanine reductase
VTHAHDLDASPLGHRTTYAEGYDPGLLFAVERAPQRAELGFGPVPPFRGVDLWTAYELSWLDAAGKPQVAIATIAVPAQSPRLVESKSVKLYLTAMNQTRFASERDVAASMTRDLSIATGATVDVSLTLPRDFAALPREELAGECLDALPIAIDRDELAPEALVAQGRGVTESLYTRLFRSVCPVTGQPDYASVQVSYRGAAIDRPGLLRYLVSFRRHPGFHEHCVERIYADIWRCCRPDTLTIYARFTRRGGIDINPFRTSGEAMPASNARTARQ